MTDKVADDDDKVIPWIASSKSSDQKKSKFMFISLSIPSYHLKDE